MKRKRSRKNKKKQNNVVANEESNINSLVDNFIENEEEAEESWFLSKLLSLKVVLLEHKIICYDKNYILQVWLIYVGNKTNKEWPTCIDSMLRDYNDWPSEELCNEVSKSLPIDTNLEIYIHDKCTTNKQIHLPIYISNNYILHKLIKNNMNVAKDFNNIPLLINPTSNKINQDEDNRIYLMSDITNDHHFTNVEDIEVVKQNLDVTELE